MYLETTMDQSLVEIEDQAFSTGVLGSNRR